MLWRYAVERLSHLETTYRLRDFLSVELPTREELRREFEALSLEFGIRTRVMRYVLVTPDDRKGIDPLSGAEVEVALERAQHARRALLGKAPPEGPPEAYAERFGRIDTLLGAPPHSVVTRRPGGGIRALLPPSPGFKMPEFFADRAAKARLRKNGGSAETEKAVDLGLMWLALHQHPSGRFGARDFEEWCRLNRCGGTGRGANDIGVTGLTLLAFLGAGNAPGGTRPYQDRVTRGLRWLMAVQADDGGFGESRGRHFVYGHAIATQAMAEAYGMTGLVFFRESAQAGLDFIAKCRNPDLAWRYGVRPGDSDTSVSAWMCLALVSGREAGLRVDDTAFAGMKRWLEKATDGKTGRTGYTAPGTGPVREGPLLDRFPPGQSESLTAAAVLCRILLGEDPAKSEAIKKGQALLLRALPRWDERSGAIDMYYWHFGSLATFLSGGNGWWVWHRDLTRALLGSQRKDADQRGSWDPVGPWGREGGRIYATALMTLCLETFYRYARRSR